MGRVSGKYIFITTVSNIKSGGSNTNVMSSEEMVDEEGEHTRITK